MYKTVSMMFTLKNPAHLQRQKQDTQVHVKLK